MNYQDILLFNYLVSLDAHKFTRQVDRHFVEHLQAIYVEGGKPITEMWPCHRERLYELGDN